MPSIDMEDAESAEWKEVDEYGRVSAGKDHAGEEVLVIVPAGLNRTTKQSTSDDGSNEQ